MKYATFLALNGKRVKYSEQVSTFRKLNRSAFKPRSHIDEAADRCSSRRVFFSFMSLLKESDGVCSEHGKGIS